jgi:hypothetical protein
VLLRSAPALHAVAEPEEVSLPEADALLEEAA